MLSLATVRQRWASFLGTFIALALGVTILSMITLVLTSAQPEVPKRYAGARVLVQSPGVDQSDGLFTANRPWTQQRAAELVQRLDAIPGVSKAVPDLSFYAQAVIDGKPVAAAEDGDLQGHAWSTSALAPQPLVAGKPPSGDKEVVLDRALGLRPGGQVTLLTATGPAQYSVSGTVDGPAFYVSDSAAAALSGGVRVIGLLTDSGVDTKAVAAAAENVVGKDGETLRGEALKNLEEKNAAKTRWIGMQILIGMASLTAFVSIFVVASTFAFSIIQRRRELGLWRTIGATPKQIRRMVYGEAVTIGVVAASVGVVLGSLLAPVLGGLFVNGGLEPPSFTVQIQVLPLIGTFTVGLLVAVLGVWSASRRAGKVRPLEALREASLEKHPMTRSRWIFASVSTLAGIALLVNATGSGSDEMINNTIYAAMALIVGLTLFAPAFIPFLVRLVWWPLRRLSGATNLVARESALTSVRRTASTAAPVLVTIGFAVLISGMFQIRATGYALEETISVKAESVVTPDGTPGLSDAAVTSVKGGASLMPTTLYPGGKDHVGGVGVSKVAFAAAREHMKVTSGSLDALQGQDTMIVRTSVAQWLNWTTGRTVPVTFDDGQTRDMRVVAEVTDQSSTAAVLLSRETVRAHDPSALTPTVYVPRSGTADIPPALGAQQLSRAVYADRTQSEDDRLAKIFIVILVGMSLGYTCLAIANTLMMATADRARDFTVLRLSGATTRQVLRIVAAESALAVGIGTVVGLTVAITALMAIRSGLSANLGTTVNLNLPWPTIVLSIGLCLFLALLSSVLPARLALRAGDAATRSA
ncbi:FtsX-like permease family protein [Rugosimonospora africana]|uniref:ABC transporter permease n=1 Tax=Rugosimonospora africana TaxID=556532 RepID=A0A8J3R2X4_9ACTN|nr:FtsX-like permease family protein [Rugosimonospora africana]GIH20567.1 ABC transporter permease [Rugosimonospora africana]